MTYRKPSRDAFTDPAYLIQREYGDPANLNARLALHQRFSTSPEPWHTWLFDRVALRDGERVLEVGCGSGALWQANAHRLRRCNVTLTDLSSGMLASARAAVGGPGWSFAVADVQCLPFRSENFDVVIGNHMLYHVRDRDRAIAELRRVVLPGGRFIAATNGRAHLRELDELMERFLGSKRGHDDAEKFGLETGLAQLKRHFARVEVTKHEDRLLVTETEALVRYILSVEDDVSEKAIEALREHVDRVIAARGHYEIAKDAGVLISFA